MTTPHNRTSAAYDLSLFDTSAKRKEHNTPEKKPEPIKAETPVENFEVTSDRMSEIDRLLKELEDKK